MDFDFTQEQVMLRGLTREFLTRESAPRAVRALMDEPRGFDAATWQQIADMGLPGLAIDGGYGGQGLGMVEQALVLDEMGRAAFPGPYFATTVLAGNAIAASGQANQQARYLPDIAHGRTLATLALIEDAVSWTSSGVRLQAVRRGDGFVLSGTKRFVPFANVADLVLVVARTSASGVDGTTVFAVPADAAGLSQTLNVEMDHTARTSTLTFAEVAVPADAVIGEVDRGWEVIGPTLQRAAVGAAGQIHRAARPCLEKFVG
jgi:alkylation response protein AidB-like acyl-CoA dehydrogenase